MVWSTDRRISLALANDKRRKSLGLSLWHYENLSQKQMINGEGTLSRIMLAGGSQAS